MRLCFFVSSRCRFTRGAYVTVVQTCALPIFEVWTKGDTSDVDRRAIIEEMAARRPYVAVISAGTGEGVEAARILRASQLTAAHQVQRIHLGYEQGDATAWLHARGEVLADEP